MLAALIGAAMSAGVAGLVTPSAAAATAPNWQEDLAQVHGDDVNVVHDSHGIRVKDGRLHPAAAAGAPGYGMVTFAQHNLSAPANQVTVDLTTQLPTGTAAQVDVRGLDAAGRWTEWTKAEGTAPATLPRAATAVQTRITLWDNKQGATPVVTGLAVATANSPTAHAVQPAATAASYQVYATDEGLVGSTTANGHVIQSNDHFVALPSGTALSPKGSGQYSVQVCGPARCETAPVWDVGPWNIKDNYWASPRAEFTDLPQGKPEAQAAYENGYHGGLDDLGTRVQNRAGIDLADGTFANIGLTDNGWVTVSYLWTSGGTPPPPSGPINLFSSQCPTDMTQGEADGCVLELQNLLNKFGAGVTADGQFGPLTYAAVRNFQSSHGLGVDGVVGPKTKQALYGGSSGGLQLVNCGTLQVGSSGACVTTLQKMLNTYGAGLQVDGQFGQNTATAVKNFQSAHGLSADGIVGPNTTYALNGNAPAGGADTLAGCGTLQQGASGPCVAALQRLLNAYGAGLQVDSQFGPNTVAAVKNFQSTHDLAVDGIVGPATTGALESGAFGSTTVDLRTACGVIVQGNTGNCVATLQTLLNQHGASLSVDGQFGPNTLAAVKNFQSAHGLPADGQVGPQTKAALYATGTGGCSDSSCSGTVDLRTQCPELQQGSAGNCVTTLQQILNTKGYSLTTDGQFGPATDSAVRNFQARAGLPVDGVVGPNTKNALYGPTPAPLPTGGNVSRADIASIALGQYGVSGSGDYCNPYGPCEYWCADFAMWVWGHAGVQTSGLNAGAISFYWWGVAHGTLERPGIARQGDAIVFATNTSSANHVALVAGVTSSGLVQEIGGDQGGKPGKVSEWPAMTLSQLADYYGAPILAVVSPISDSQTHS